MKSDRIVQREGKFCAVSEDGETSFGCFDTEDEANERLRQVEAAVAAKGDFFEQLSFAIEAQAVIQAVKGDDHEVHMPGVSASRFTMGFMEPAPRVDGPVFRIDRIGPIHFDKDRADGFFAEITAEGFLRCDGRMTRTGVLFYSDGEGNEWGEFLDESEVFDEESLASFQMLVITDDHPAGMVSSDNVKDVQVGHTGNDARRDGDFMRGSLLITDKDVIRSAQDGKVELSLGYFAQVIQDAGVAPDGTPFTHRQTNRRGNHLAIVVEGRAGPACRLLLDSGDAFTPEEIFTMKNKDDKKKDDDKDKAKKDATILVGGEEHEVSDEVADAFKQMADKMEEQAAELSKLKEPAAADEEDSEHENEEVVTVTTDKNKDKGSASNTDAMQAQIDSLKGQLKDNTDGQDAMIDTRVALVVKAKDVLGDKVQTDGVSNVNIQKAIVKEITPSMNLDGKSADYVQAAFEMACEQHANKVDSSEELLQLTRDAVLGGDDEDIDQMYADNMARIGRRKDKKEAS